MFLNMQLQPVHLNVILVKWVLVKFVQDGIIEVVKATDVEDVETGENGMEGQLEIGQVCLARYGPEKYEATIEHVSGKLNIYYLLDNMYQC